MIAGEAVVGNLPKVEARISPLPFVCVIPPRESIGNATPPSHRSDCVTITIVTTDSRTVRPTIYIFANSRCGT